jgi:hypothetical protein
MDGFINRAQLIAAQWGFKSLYDYHLHFPV